MEYYRPTFEGAEAHDPYELRIKRFTVRDLYILFLPPALFFPLEVLGLSSDIYYHCRLHLYASFVLEMYAIVHQQYTLSPPYPSTVTFDSCHCHLL